MHRRLQSRGELGDQPLGVLSRASGDANLCEVPHPNHGVGVRPGLHATAEQRQDSRAGARQVLHGERRRGGGSHRGDVGAVHQRDRLPVGGVEKQDHRLMSGQRTPGISWKEAHQLGAQPRQGREIRGHGSQQALRFVDPRGDPRRHRRAPGADVAEGVAHRSSQGIEFENRFHVGAAEDQHQLSR